jgi:hypothetical protein
MTVHASQPEVKPGSKLKATNGKLKTGILLCTEKNKDAYISPPKEVVQDVSIRAESIFSLPSKSKVQEWKTNFYMSQ